MKRVTATKEDEKAVRLAFESVDVRGKRNFLFEATDAGHPDLDNEPLWICAEKDKVDISIFLTRKEAALLRDFIEVILNDTE